MPSTILPITIPDKQLPDPARRLSSGFVKANGRPAGLWLPSKLAKAAADFSGNRNFGTLNGGVTTSGNGVGVLGQSWNFGGDATLAQNVIPISTSTALNPSAAITVAARFKAVSGTGSATWQVIFGRGTPFVAWSYMLLYNGNDLRFYAPATGSNFAVASGIGKDVWVTAVGRFDGAHVQLNARTDSGTSFTSSVAQTGTLATNSIATAIGRGGASGGAYNQSDAFGGLVSFAEVFPGVWSDAQVSALYSSLLYGEPYRLFDQTANERFIGNVTATGGLLLARRRAAAA